MTEQETRTHYSKDSRKMKSYLDDLSPFYDEETANRQYKKYNSKETVGNFMQEIQPDEFKYTKDEDEYSRVKSNPKIQNEEMRVDYNHDSENLSPFVQNALYYDKSKDKIDHQSIKKTLQASQSNYTNTTNMSKYQPYRPSFANLNGYSEKMKEIKNIMNSDIGNTSIEKESSYRISITPNRVFGTDFQDDNRVISTPKLSTRSKEYQDPRIREEENDYSRTIRNVPQRELGETRRSKMTNFSRQPLSQNQSNLPPQIYKESRNGFNNEEEKLRVIQMIKGTNNDELCGSFISSYRQTINEDTLLEPDDYSKYLSRSSIISNRNERDDHKQPRFSKANATYEQDNTQECEFKILSKFQKFDISGSISKDFSKDFEYFNRKNNPSYLRNSKDDSKNLETKPTSADTSSYRRKREREEIRVTDLEENYQYEQYIPKERQVFKKKNYENHDFTKNPSPNQVPIREEVEEYDDIVDYANEEEDDYDVDLQNETEFIGDTTLMELQ